VHLEGLLERVDVEAVTAEVAARGKRRGRSDHGPHLAEACGAAHPSSARWLGALAEESSPAHRILGICVLSSLVHLERFVRRSQYLSLLP
jgi:hypothetical protein